MTFLRWGCSFLNWDILTFNRWNGVKDEKYGGSLKNPIFRGGILKNQYIRVALTKREGVVFEGEVVPQCTP